MTAAPNFDAIESEDEVKKFTSWKLDLLDAIASDPTVPAGAFRVAFIVAQHLSKKSLVAFPGQQTIADMAGLKIRQVRTHLSALAEKGWLNIRRGRHNTYAFNINRLGMILDYQADLRDRRLEERERVRLATRRKIAGEARHTGNSLPLQTGNLLPLQTGSGLPPNTSVEHHQGTPPLESGIDKRELRRSA